jgi:hypothetical protein
VRAWGIPWSTNCERVSIAAALAGVDVDWTLVTFDDRTLIEELSGQKGVPIAELGGKIVASPTSRRIRSSSTPPTRTPRTTTTSTRSCAEGSPSRAARASPHGSSA